jgi:small subunit ribosomal protein S20
MPSEKSHRTTVRKTAFNRISRGSAKTAVIAARRSVVADNKEKAQAAVVSATVSLARAASSGVIHRNNASRRISRLAKHLNNLNKPS